MARNPTIFLNKTRNILDLNTFNEACIASNPKIQIVLKFGNENLRFTLSEALTVEEEAALDTLISGFVDSDPDSKTLKIYSFAKEEAKHKHFHNIDYKKELTTSLIPKRTVVKGEVIKVDWYASLDAEMKPTNLILTVNITYTRNAGFATYRITERTWFNEDGSENIEKKITEKYYFINPSDTIDEGIKRRKLLVNNIQMPVLTFMTEALTPLGYSEESVVLQGRHFMDDYETDFNKFIENSSTITNPADAFFGEKSIIVEFKNEDAEGRNKEYHSWLDVAPPSLGGMMTIRQYLIEEFSI